MDMDATVIPTNVGGMATHPGSPTSTVTSLNHPPERLQFHVLGVEAHLLVPAATA